MTCEYSYCILFKIKVEYDFEFEAKLQMAITTAEILKDIDIPRHKLYYLEQKGFIRPQKIQVGEKEFRQYSKDDAKKIALIWGYLKKGYKYRVAYEKAMDDLKSHSLFREENAGGS